MLIGAAALVAVAPVVWLVAHGVLRLLIRKEAGNAADDA